MYKRLVRFVRDIYQTNDFIPLHAPLFNGDEKKYLSQAIDSTFVSSVGNLVNEFEKSIMTFTNSAYAIAIINGTSALHLALEIAGVKENTEVLTQSLTFVGTCNAIRYCGSEPIFIDVDKNTLGLSPSSLIAFIDENCELRNDGFCWNKKTNKKIIACVPMHTFGFPADCLKIKKICSQFNIQLIEDAAESLGSTYQNKHTGTFGEMGILSFNGNKIITTGSGGMILTNNNEIAHKAKHLSSTAKLNHPWEFNHDEVGYNYRLPNLNSALGIAQMQKLKGFVQFKRSLAKKYQMWGKENGLFFLTEPRNTNSNYWLNTIITENSKEKEQLLLNVNKMNVMVRPAWRPMHMLKIYEHCQKNSLQNTEFLYDRIVNVPSSVSNNNIF